MTFLQLIVEPFVPSVLSHAPSPTAYPFDRTTLYTPFDIFATWLSPSADATFHAALDEIEETLYKQLEEEGYEGARKAQVYANYASAGTEKERIWGGAWEKLKALKERVDPEGVMELTGGWKV